MSGPDPVNRVVDDGESSGRVSGFDMEERELLESKAFFQKLKLASS